MSIFDAIAAVAAGFGSYVVIYELLERRSRRERRPMAQQIADGIKAKFAGNVRVSRERLKEKLEAPHENGSVQRLSDLWRTGGHER